jgi:hypothetical protein
MSRGVRRAVALLSIVAALIVMVVAVRRDREGAMRRVELHDTTAVAPGASGEAPPPRELPQVATGDSAMRRMAPRLEEWAAMWRAAMPGFRIDSLYIANEGPAFRGGYVRPAGELYPGPSAGGARRPVLEADSRDGRHRLVFDWYRWVEERNGKVEASGEPESAPLLVDLHGGTANRFEFCGTPCAFDWGAWLSNDRFVLGGHEEVDATGRWRRGRLRLYSIADSTVTTYVTRPVPYEDFERYRRAWDEWVAARYRALGARPGTE